MPKTTKNIGHRNGNGHRNNGHVTKSIDASEVKPPDQFMTKAIPGNRIEYGLMSEQTEGTFLKGCVTGQPIDQVNRGLDLRIPQSYHGQAKKSWEMYSTDRLFRYMIDRCVDYGANGFEWELPIDDPSEVITPNALPTPENPVPAKPKKTKALKKIEQEKKVWDYWASYLNKETGNVMPGIDEINKWIIKQLLLGGMSPMEWEWGTITVDGVKYDMPVRMTTHNVLSTVMERKNQIFLQERVFIKLVVGQKDLREGASTNHVAGYNNLSSFFDKNSWHEVQILGDKGEPKVGRKTIQNLQGFVIKYNWTPADNTCTIAGLSFTTGQGLYPQPPFYGLNEVLVLRRQLAAADIAILDGIINYIIEWEIGDATKDEAGNLVHEPMPARYDANGTKIAKSTIESVAEMITADNRTNVMQLFHPYYYKLKITMPDINSMVSNEKYIHSTNEMFMAFGIFLSLTDRRIDFTAVNTANFEQMLDNIRLRHIKRFWEMLCTEIVDRNEGKLENIPNMVFNPLNTEDNDFRTGLLSLAKIGKVSIDSLLKAHKLDKRTELVRIAKEVSSGEKDMMDNNVPVSFVQRTVNADGSNASHSNSGSNEGGRPVTGTQAGKPSKSTPKPKPAGEKTAPAEKA